MRNVIYVGGSKGGTGKSLVSMSLVDYIRKTFPGEKILLLETDTSNPDVGRLYKKMDDIEVKGVPLDIGEKGWVSMIDYIDESDAPHVLINSMAASNVSIQQQGSLFEESLKKLDVHFKVFWVMNRTKDSVTLLRDFLAYIKSAAMFPVLNLYFGIEEDFQFYRSSLDIQEVVKESGGWQLLFPNLNDLIADKLYTDEICFENMPLHLKLGMRTSLERWLSRVKQVFDSVFLPVNAEEQNG